MKKLFTNPVIIALIYIISIINAAKAQSNAPMAEEDFVITLQNIVQTAPNVLEFDIYIQDTDPSQVLEMATFQGGINFNSVILNGGAITSGMTTVVPGTSDLPSTMAPISVNTANLAATYSFDLIRIAGRAAPGFGGGYIISTEAPGTRIIRLRMTNSLPFLNSSTPDFVFNSNTVSSPLYPTRFAYYNQTIYSATQASIVPGVNCNVMENPIIYGTSRLVRMDLALEGFYNPITGLMRKARLGNFPDTIADQITIKLANQVFPYSVIFEKDTINVNLTGTCSFEPPVNFFGNYYIIVKHRNSIETWSKIPVSFNAFYPDTIKYSFTDAPNKAFNNNLKLVGSKYCIYGGDINQDGFVDSGDMGILDNESNQFVFGYNPSDVNGDGFTDSGDIILVDNNSYFFVGSSAPTSQVPEVLTSNVSEITSNSAVCGGEVLSQGTTLVTARGICWNTSPNPDIQNYSSNNGSGPGIFTSQMTGLLPNTTYYVRAYATNSTQTVYSYQLSFTTNPTFASLTTSSITDITGLTATSGGDVISDGGLPVTQRGICWGVSPNPTIDDNFTNDGSGTGNYVSYISGLTINTVYYVRAYAINSVGVSYGNEVMFTTAAFIPGNGVVDVDGNAYTSIIYGDQEWMARNLKVSRYSNNDLIAYLPSNTQWSSSASGAYCWYNNDDQYKATYGMLYNFYAVTDSRNICPSGWHIPTDSDWDELQIFFGGADIAGGALKEAGTAHWNTPNTDATNISGFTGLPGGIRLDSGIFNNIGAYGIWWSSDELNANAGWYRSLLFNSGSINRSSNHKRYGFSVRCVKD